MNHGHIVLVDLVLIIFFAVLHCHIPTCLCALTLGEKVLSINSPKENVPCDGVCGGLGSDSILCFYFQTTQHP